MNLTGRQGQAKKQRIWCYICRTEGHLAQTHPDFDPDYRHKKEGRGETPKEQSGGASGSTASDQPPAKTTTATDLYRAKPASILKGAPRKVDFTNPPASINMLCRSSVKTINLTERETASDEYILDNGAQCHTSGESRWFSAVRDTDQQLEFSNGGTAKGYKGTLRIKIDGVTLCLDGATYCLDVRRNLLSMHKLLKKGFVVTEFTTAVIILHHPDHDLSLTFRERAGLYRIGVETDTHQVNAVVCAAQPARLGGAGATAVVEDDADHDDGSDAAASLSLWHRRFNHANDDAIHHALPGLLCKRTADCVCVACQLGKARRVSYQNQNHWVADRPLMNIHGDLAGPVDPASHDGAVYTSVLVDANTNYIWLSCITRKNDALVHI